MGLHLDYRLPEGPISSHKFIEELDALVERLVKRFFFGTNCFFDCLLFRADFGEGVAHRLSENIDELVEKRFVKTERATITNRSTQDATQDVAPSIVWRDDSVPD